MTWRTISRPRPVILRPNRDVTTSSGTTPSFTLLIAGGLITDTPQTWKGMGPSRQLRTGNAPTAGTIRPHSETKALPHMQFPHSQLQQALHRSVTAVLLLGSVLANDRAFAQLETTATASATVEHNSNIFALADATPTPAPYAGSAKGTTVTTLSADIQPTYRWSRQRLNLDFRASNVRYGAFETLNHHELRGAADLLWELGTLLDGDLGASRERRMVPFSDLQTTELVLETDTRGTATLNFQLDRHWRLETGATARRTDEPRKGLPSLALRESYYSAAIKFSEQGDVFVGLLADRYNGQFSGTTGLISDSINGVVDYHRTTAHLVAERKAGKNDLVHGEIGYTQTDSGTSIRHPREVTGALAYLRELTGKTSIDLKASREVSANVSNASQEVASIGDLGLKWHATGKIDIAVDGRISRSTFPGWSLVNAGQGTSGNGIVRADKVQSLSVQLVYSILPRLSISPYAKLQKRRSNIDAYTYSESIYGLEIKGTLP